MDTPPPITPVPPDPLPPAKPGISPSQWKTFLHLSGLVGLIVPTAGNIIAPLVIWLMKKDDLPALDLEGRKVLNFQISYTIYLLVSGIIAATLAVLILPLVLPAVVWIAWLILTIIGSVKTGNGEDYQYPFVIRIL